MLAALKNFKSQVETMYDNLREYSGRRDIQADVIGELEDNSLPSAANLLESLKTSITMLEGHNH